MFDPAKTILLASGNKGKIAEFAELLADFELEVVGLDAFPDFEEVEETGLTFEENALLKARAASAHSGLVALSDDSGLCVEALDGAPGVYSARFSLMASNGISESSSLVSGMQPDKTQKDYKARLDEANIAKLLQAMREVPPEERSAFFCSVIAACAPGENNYITARGEWPGQITRIPLGSGGFGYDPVFFDPKLKLTAAQMSMEVKNSRSHRARALRELRLLWPDFWQRANKAR
ncbi:MAG: RdgB/HAM1 family non-canonical purine NTP pyrophosphatase [Deltaproteobacteria bacterium]|jgi:XTP/dITP diphosphohydrolase|nr:RdgB/HAM1 family non-canonical purine NTP pyrophosphatase [Deltaproteobacteria bacterium]